MHPSWVTCLNAHAEFKVQTKEIPPFCGGDHKDLVERVHLTGISRRRRGSGQPKSIMRWTSALNQWNSNFLNQYGVAIGSNTVRLPIFCAPTNRNFEQRGWVTTSERVPVAADLSSANRPRPSISSLPLTKRLISR